MKIHYKSVHYIDGIVILYFFHVVHIMRGPKSSLFHVVFSPRWFLPIRVTPMVQNPGDMLLVFTFEIHQSCEYSERFRDSLMTVYYFHITIFFCRWNAISNNHNICWFFPCETQLPLMFRYTQKRFNLGW